MHIAATVPLPAAPERVWALLINPDAVSQCVPGLRQWRALEADHDYRLWINWRVTDGASPEGVPVRLTWQSLTPPEQFTITAEVAWRETAVPVTGVVDLIPTSRVSTDLTFRLDLHTENKLLMQMAANIVPKAADAFFTCFKKQLRPA